MTHICWWLVEVLSRTLEPDERDAVRGDFAESGITGSRALLDLLGLIALRQAALWRDWRPWLALIGVVAPLGLFLGLVSRRFTGSSATTIWLYANNWTWIHLTNTGARRDLFDNIAAMLMQYLVLACWSWTCGLMLGALSRRARGVTGCLFCMVLLSVDHLQRSPNVVVGSPGGSSPVFSLTFYGVMFPLLVKALLVLLPALWGIHQSVRLATLPIPLRTILWTCAIATIVPLAGQCWRWIPYLLAWPPPPHHVPFLSGREGWQVLMLPLALFGPFAYFVLCSAWVRWCELARKAGASTKFSA